MTLRRLCGHIFCASCAGTFTHLSGSKKSVRVCSTCNDLLATTKMGGAYEIESSTIARETDGVLSPTASTSSLAPDTPSEDGSASGEQISNGSGGMPAVPGAAARE